MHPKNTNDWWLIALTCENLVHNTEKLSEIYMPHITCITWLSIRQRNRRFQNKHVWQPWKQTMLNKTKKHKHELYGELSPTMQTQFNSSQLLSQASKQCMVWAQQHHRDN